MYRPDHDTRATGPDTPRELQAKRELIAAFTQLRETTERSERARIGEIVRRAEAVLEAELYRSVKKLEGEDRPGGAA
jgi:hypothetical protein